MSPLVFILRSLALAGGALQALGAPQCTSFEAAFGRLPGAELAATFTPLPSFAAFDAGQGPRVYVCGRLDTLGGVSVGGLASWDGATWSPVFQSAAPGFQPNLTSGLPTALETWDDGSGPALFVGGYFSGVQGLPVARIARWDGSSWSALGAGLTNSVPAATPHVETLLGIGGELYVGGWFGNAGGATANHVARWNGAAWSPLASGVNGTVYALAQHDDGTGGGPRLYVGGRFSAASGTPTQNLAIWDGASWSALNLGLPQSEVRELASFDDGSGPALYVYANAFVSGAFDGIKRWRQGIVSDVTPPSFEWMDGWAVVDLGAGPALHASLARLGPPTNRYRFTLERLDGSAWTELVAANERITALEAIDLGQAPSLYVGGGFQVFGDTHAIGLARFDGTATHALPSGAGIGGTVESIAVHDDGTGAAVYCDSAGPLSEAVLRWDAPVWRPVGAPSNGEIHALVSHDAGQGPRLFAAGNFTAFGTTPIRDGIAEFDGSGWRELAPSAANSALHTWVLRSWNGPSGPLLIAGGEFLSLGGAPLSRIAAWDGANWSSLAGGANEQVFALAESNGDLIAGGAFTSIGGVAATRIARWDGAQWHALGAGFDNAVWSLAVFDDGSGESLYAGGEFMQSGGIPVKHVARWDGSQWSAVGAGFDFSVSALEVFDFGAGPRLVAGGPFGASGTTPMHFAATWDGASWSELDSTLDNEVRSVRRVPLASGEEALWLGGAFRRAGGVASQHVAELRRSFPCAPTVYCTAQQNSAGCVPAISATGTPSAAQSTFRVRATNVLANKNGFLFWGLAASATPFHGGFKCVRSPTRRTPFQNSGGNPPPEDCSGSFAQFFGSAYLAAWGLTPGTRLYCQYWSRDPLAPSTTNLSDALSVLIAP